MEKAVAEGGVSAVKVGLTSFEVLALERTLVEKILALVRANHVPGLLAELHAKVRRAYDLHQLPQRPTLRAFLASADFMDPLAEARAVDARLSDARRKASALHGPSRLRHLSGVVQWALVATKEERYVLHPSVNTGPPQ